MQMKLMKVVLLVCVCLSVLPAQCMCFSRGASTATCMDMKPGHISAQPQHTHTASAVTIHTSRIVYLPHHTLMVSVRSSRAFMGLLLHARSVVEDRVVGGKFTLHPPGTHTLSCLSTADTVTHSDKLMKRNLSFTWRAPAQPSGDLRFYITVVHSYFVYWTRIHSAVVHDGTRTGHEPGLQIGIISASPTSSTLTHTSVHTLSEHSNTTHNFLTHTDKHTGTYDPSNRVTHTQLYAMTHTHNHTHTTKGSVNTLHVHTHTHSRPDIAYTPSHTQKHAATTPVTHTHTSPNTVLMSHSLTTHTPRTHMHSLSTACTSPVVTMVTLITRTYTSHGYTLAPSQHTHSSNILTHTPTVSHTPTGSHTPSHTPTASNTFTHTITESNTPTAPHILTHTPARSNTPTHTPTAPHILTHTPARSNTPKHTPTAPHILTHTPARSNTPKHTPTAPHILTHTPAGSNTPTHTPTAPHILTHTPAGLYTPTHPPTGLYTSTHPPTGVYTPTHPPTVVYTPTHTPTGLYTPTHTPTGLYTPTNTPTGLYTPTNTPTGLNTPTHTPTGSYTPPHSPSESNTPTHTPVPSSALHPEPSAALRRSVSEPVEPRDDPVVFVKLPDPEPHPESGIKTGGGVKAEPGVGFVSQPVMLMVLSLVLLVMLAVYVQRKHCVRRNGVSLSDSRQESAGVRRVQECGELVQLRRIRENSLLLLQAQYDIITAPGN